MASDKFFSDDYLDRLNPQQQVEQGPVMVFGLTFKNDEERRQYFREELRRRLPELRKIEGFPIGEDDDIINLSDPPYYTACPNPWLNDFIKQWEEEKKELQREGKRKTDFEVKEPYASDVSEGKTNPVYTAHTYHTKVPHPAIMRYILHYTQPGDVVFDGFAGTGMTGVAAQACGDRSTVYSTKIADEWKTMFHSTPQWGVRHAICGDLSPYAADMSFCYNTPLDVPVLQKEINRITKELNDECGWLYQTLDENGKPNGKINCVVWSDVFVCPNCGKEYVFWDASMDYENKCIKDDFCCPHCHSMQTKKSSRVAMETVYDDALKETIQKVKIVPVIIAYTVGKKRFEKKADDFDKELIKKIESLEISDFYPTDRLPEGYNTEQPKRSRNISCSSVLYKT